MGDVVQLAEARARRLRERGAAHAPAIPRAFEAVEYGSGWYHGEAVRASRKPAEPR